MASPLMEAPVEATKMAAHAAVGGGRLALEAGGSLVDRVIPGRVPPEVAARQAILRQFEHRFAIVDLLDPELPEDELEPRAYMTADAMVDAGIVDQHAAVELRPVLPEDTLRDREWNKRRERALALLQLAFEEDHNVMALPTSHPITPSVREDGPVDAAAAWRAFAPELDGLAHQFRGDADYEPAMVGLTDPAYERAMFGGQVLVRGRPLGSTVLALEEVGSRPEDNVFAWVHQPPAQPAAEAG